MTTITELWNDITKLSDLYKKLLTEEKKQLNILIDKSNKLLKALVNQEGKKDNLCDLEKNIDEIKDNMNEIENCIKKNIIKLHDNHGLKLREIENELRKIDNIMYLYAQSTEKLNDNALLFDKKSYVIFLPENKHQTDQDIKTNLNNLDHSCIVKVKDEFILKQMMLKQYKEDVYDDLNDY